MSNRRTGGVLTLVALAFTGGCGSSSYAPPATTTPSLSTIYVTGNVNRTRTVELRHDSSVGERRIEASLSDVWAAMPAVFAQLDVPTTTVDATAGVIGNSSFRARRIGGQRMSDFLDCGSSFGRNYADSYAVNVGLLVQLVPTADGFTVVRTVLDAFARDPGTSGNSVHCITWGSLETRIADLVIEVLAS